jgi:hypothetical protein
VNPPGNEDQNRWAGSWLDAVAFAGGLAMAWWGEWKTTDLVWSLWLSSLIVGYSIIVWTLSAGAREFVTNVAADRMPNMGLAKVGVGGLIGVGLVFSLAFFTVHFGGFHFVHSVFLAQFFPIDGAGVPRVGFPNLATYAEVFRRYWIFLPVAFLAERAAFKRFDPRPANSDVTAEAITRRKFGGGGELMAPYRNVIRMHLLIFFFAAAHFLKLESFLVYGVVYAVYFFPWRALRTQQVQIGR